MKPLRVAWLWLTVLLALGVHSQGFNTRYDAFGQGYAQGSYGIERAGSGWLMLSGSFEPDTITPDSLLATQSIILQHIDAQGALIWQRRYHRPLHQEYLGWSDCCDTVPGDGFVVGGSSQNIDDADEARLVRFNTQGDSLWSRTFGSPNAFWIGQQVKHTQDGGFIICGITDAVGEQDAFALKTDALGNEEWRHTYGVGGPVTEAFSAVVELADGYLCTGRSRPDATDGDMYAVRLNSVGDEIWTRDWGGDFDDAQVHSYLCQDGSALLAGGLGYSNDGESTVPYLAKLDTMDGALNWEHEYGAPLFGTLFFAARECPNTDIIACGVTYEGGWEQGLLLRTTSNGDSLWMRRYASFDDQLDSCEGRFWDVLPTNDGGFIASGFANLPYEFPFPPGISQDAWVVKVDSLGCIVPGCDGTGVTEIITNLTDALTVWPNPISASNGLGQVQVELKLPPGMRENDLDLSIISAEGRVVRRVPWQPANTMVLDVRNLSSGMYTLHVTRGTTWITGSKLVVE